MDTTSVVNFYQNDYPCSSFAAFEEMRKRKQLCDIVIKVQNHSFAVHRVIIAGGIPYFQSLLISIAENSCKQEIVLGDLDPAAVESLISFAYSGKVDISTENVKCLLLASQFLQVHQVSDACVEFISNRLNFSSVVQECAFARDTGIESFIEKINVYIQKNFAEFSKSDYFLSLPHSCVQEVICSDDLNVSSEDEVFKAVMRWVKAAPSERRGRLSELLSEVRLVQLPVEYLIKEIAPEELIQTSKPCMELLDEVKNYHLLPKVASQFSVLKTVRRNATILSTDPVKVCDTQQGLYAVYYCEKFGIVRYRDVSKKTWCEVSVNQLNDPISCVVAVNDKIYMFLARTIQTFSMTEAKWEVIESSHKDISADAIMFYKNIIYLFCNIIYCYDTVQNKWMNDMYCTLSVRRRDLAVCCLGGFIYVTGGSIVQNSVSYVNSIAEKFCRTEKHAITVSPMLTERAGHGCTSMNEKIYVCGGYRWHKNVDKYVKVIINSAEVYDPPTGKWNFISSMNSVRCSFSFVACSGKLFAVGGYRDDDTAASDVEVFNPVTKVWTCDFNRGLLLGGLKAVVLIPTASN